MNRVATAALLSLLLCPASTRAQEPPDAEGAAAALAPAPLEPVPRAAIGRRIEETFRELQDVTPRLRREPGTVLMRSAVPAFRERVRRLAQQPALERLRTLHPASLHDLSQEWSRVHAQLTDWQGRLEVRSTTLAEEREHILRSRRLWRLSLDAERERPLTDAQRVRIDSLLERIRRVKRRLNRREEEVLSLQGQLSDEGLRIAAVMARIQSAQRRARQRRAERDHAALWRGWRPVDEDLAPPSIGAVATEHGASISTFLRLERAALTAHALWFAALLGLFVWLRRRLAPAEASERASAHRAMRGAPTSSAVVLALCVAPLLYAYMPRVIGGLTLILMLPAIVALLPYLLPSAPRPMKALLTLAAVSVPINLGLAPAALQRWLVLGISLASIAAVGALFHPRWSAEIQRARPDRRRLYRLTQLAILPLAFAVYCTASGFTERGQLWTAGTLQAIEGGLALFFAAQLIVAALREGLRAKLAARISFTVRARRRRVSSLLARLVRWGALALFLYTTLVSFDALDPTVDTLRLGFRRTFTFGEIELSIGDLVSFLSMLLGTFVVMRIVHSLLEQELLPRLALEQGIASAISLTVSYILVAIGVVLAFGSAGVGPERLALLGGALGVGIGFGLQNVVSNFVSGLILVAERPIKVGDVIEIGDLVGTVRRIGIRSSTVESLDGAEVIVPNADLIAGRLVNWTHSDARRRLKLSVGTGYGHSPEHVARVLTQVVKSQPGVFFDPAPDVLCEGFGDSSVNFVIRGWTGGYLDAIRIKSELAARVYAALGREGIEIPFPQRDLNLRSVTPEAAGRLRAATARVEPTESAALDPVERGE